MLVLCVAVIGLGVLASGHTTPERNSFGHDKCREDDFWDMFDVPDAEIVLSPYPKSRLASRPCGDFEKTQRPWSKNQDLYLAASGLEYGVRPSSETCPVACPCGHGDAVNSTCTQEAWDAWDATLEAFLDNFWKMPESMPIQFPP